MLKHSDNRTVFARIRNILVCYHDICDQVVLIFDAYTVLQQLVIYVMVTNQNAANSTALTTTLIDNNNNND